ncbi:glycosyltransferase [Paludibaculum fermentans]|uniref:glycosyltransferase n=1 Tax=Paludibaculum fermentans TaxID=1473598 RepID=UPI003EB86026
MVIPVWNGELFLADCLRHALAAAEGLAEVIVVDDGSTDNTRAIAQQFPVQLLALPGRSGPSHARNAGAAACPGEILFFLDADVNIPPDFIRSAVQYLDRNPDWSALFASYQRDSLPTNFCSRYKNLVHHHTHQQALPEAITFCGGYGFVRRHVFEECGGFDESLHALEDIDLGYRMHKAGHRIRLCKDLQASHAKYYTLRGLLVSDLQNRAIPWTELMIRHRIFRADLNTGYRNVLSVPISFLLVASVANPILLAALALVFLLLNWALLRLAGRTHGLWFAVRTALMHWLIYCLSGIGLILGLSHAASQELRSREVRPA